MTHIATRGGEDKTKRIISTQKMKTAVRIWKARFASGLVRTAFPHGFHLCWYACFSAPLYVICEFALSAPATLAFAVLSALSNIRFHLRHPSCLCFSCVFTFIRLVTYFCPRIWPVLLVHSKRRMLVWRCAAPPLVQDKHTPNCQLCTNLLKILWQNRKVL